MELIKILQEAVDRKASDVHLKVGSPPILRIDGSLKQIGEEIITPEYTKRIVEEILNEEMHEKLVKLGELDFSYSIYGLGRFRVNSYRQRGSYCLAMRLVNMKIPTLRELNIPESVEHMTNITSGIILITGPTGSGKSTTLASIIQAINEKKDCHIMTLEDPIEYLFKNDQAIIGQREIGQDSRNFASALRACLRQDPDIILVGEMRDLETIEIALTAAETGHLVLSTLHTLGAANTIARMIDAFPLSAREQVRVQVANVLQGVVSQQLLKRKGVEGRIPACEIMIPTSGIRNLIREEKTNQIDNDIQTGKSLGMITMDDSLKKLYQTGMISRESALQHAFDRQELIKSIGY